MHLRGAGLAAIAMRRTNPALRELGGRGAGRDAVGMAGWDPSGSRFLIERLRGVRKPQLRGAGQFGGGLVSELTDRAVLVGCVLLVPDGRGGCSPDQRDRQNGDPGAPARATSRKPCVHGSSFDHQPLKLAETGRGQQETVEHRILKFF